MTRLERLRTMMAVEGLDALVACSPNSIFYATGMALHAQRKTAPNHGSRLVEDAAAAVVVPGSGAMSVMLPLAEAGAARILPSETRVTVYDPARDAPATHLADLLTAMGLSTARPGVEKRYLTASLMEELVGHLPQARFLACDALLDAAIAIKTPEDVAILQRAARITEQVMYDTLRSARRGEAEKHLADRLAANVLSAGADGLYAAVVGVGPNSTHAHNRPGDRRMATGDVVRVDFGARFAGYASDVARTAVVGRASPAQRDRWRTLWETERETIAQMRPGVVLCELYEYARRRYDAAGEVMRFPHIGHSFSYGGHDNPMITPFNRTVIEPGMVFYVELLWLVPGQELYHIEDLVAITSDGSVLLSDQVPTQELWIVDPEEAVR